MLSNVLLNIAEHEMEGKLGGILTPVTEGQRVTCANMQSIVGGTMRLMPRIKQRMQQQRVEPSMYLS